MEWSGKINSWAWVKHLKYIEKRREERYFGKRKKEFNRIFGVVSKDDVKHDHVNKDHANKKVINNEKTRR